MTLPHLFGLQKTSLNDYPGKIASVLFFPGCNLRCAYCHNPDLVLGTTEGLIDRNEVFDFLKNRASLLGGVVISGGEPLLFRNLSDFIAEVKVQTGLPVKLDTNGILTDSLSDLLQSENPPDFIAMDIKSSLKQYSRLGLESRLHHRIEDSVNIILQSGIPSQFRTTVHPEFIDQSVVEEISNLIKGCSDYVLNGFQPGNCLDPVFNSHEAVSDSFLKELQSEFICRGVPCRVPSIQYGSDSF